MTERGLDIVVLVAPVHDCRNRIAIEPGGKRIDPRSFHWIMNPSDASALETALRLRAATAGARIRVTSMAGPTAEPVLRECLAVGADEVVRVWDDALEACDSYATGVILAAAIQRAHFDVLLCGSRRADLGHGQVGPILTEILKLPFVFAACDVRLGPCADRVVVHKRVPGHLITLSCPLPAMVTLEAGPALRYPRYPDRRRADRCSIPALDLASLGLSVDVIRSLPRTAVERFTPPKPSRRSAAASDASRMSTAARIRRLIGDDVQDTSDRKAWQCKDRESVEKLVQHMLSEKIVVL